MSSELPTSAYRVILHNRPKGALTAQTFQTEQFTLPELGDGEFLVRNRMLSLAPAMRAWLHETPTYRAPMAIGEAIPGRALGEVIASRHPSYKPGDVVTGPFGMTTATVSDGSDVVVCDLELAAPATWLGVLDTNGLTAYFGLFDVGRFTAGDTVVVSAAAGSVGSVVVQLARIHGAGRVIGIAGGEEQCRWLEEIGADVAIDYRADDVEARVAEAAPDGVDVFFDNVGGTILDAVMMHLAIGARIVICGAIATYNEPGVARGPAGYLQLLFQRASMAGFVTTDFAGRYGEARRDLARWHREGKIVAREHVVPGTLDDFGAVFARLFAPGKTGKLVLELTPEA